MITFDWLFFSGYCAVILLALAYSLVRDMPPVFNYYITYQVHCKIVEKEILRHLKGMP